VQLPEELLRVRVRRITDNAATIVAEEAR